MCTPQLDRSEMFTELYRDEKKEEGDRGGQKPRCVWARESTAPAQGRGHGRVRVVRLADSRPSSW